MSDLSEKLVTAEEKIKELQLEVERLAEENNHLSRLYSQLPISYQSLNEDGNLVNVNEAWLEHLGYNRDEVIGQHFSHFLSLESQELFKKRFPCFKQIGQVSDVGFDMLKKDGDTTPVLFTGQIGKDSRGNFQQTYCVFHDVSDIQQAEKQLRASHERLLLVLDSVDASVYVATLDSYEILFMNRYMRETFGEDKIGQQCWKVFRNESGPCEICTNGQLVDSNGKPDGVYVWHDKNPVINKWFVNHDRAIEWIDGRLVKIQIAIDISELKEAEQELQQARKMESVGTLASGIAHDFNNLLGVILGNAELATDSVDSFNPAFDNLQEIETASLRAKKLVEQLLHFSKKSSPVKEQVDWTTLISGMAGFFEEKTPAKIELELNTPKDPLYVMGDELQLQNALKNIYINACDSIDSSGKIEINLFPVHSDDLKWRPKDSGLEGRWLQLQVKDNGIGMDPKTINKIFDPYFTTQEFGRGAGLGLATTHGIVKSHYGHIMVQSELGEGTSVSILLPQADVGSGAGGLDAEADNSLARLLVVDDEPLISKMLTQMLSRIGYEVTASTCPIDALRIFSKTPDRFDLVLTDMAMPELDGLELIKKIRQINAEVPVVISTGNNTDINEFEVQSLNIAGFLKKPARKKELADLVSTSLNT